MVHEKQNKTKQTKTKQKDVETDQVQDLKLLLKGQVVLDEKTSKITEIIQGNWKPLEYSL